MYYILKEVITTLLYFFAQIHGNRYFLFLPNSDTLIFENWFD